MVLWLTVVLAVRLLLVAGGIHRKWTSDTFDHVLCDQLLPYPNATFRSGIAPYKAHFYWCDQTILSIVVAGRFRRNFTTLIGQVRDEQNDPIGWLRSHCKSRIKSHNCHGLKTTVTINSTKEVMDLALFWHAPTKWNATLVNTTLLLTVGKRWNLYRLMYRIPEFEDLQMTNPPPEGFHKVVFPYI